MTDKNLYYIPLGGAGEIGMNVYLYGYDDQWLMVDCGVNFADAQTPGIDVILPDLRFLDGKNLCGIVITHGHEDHLGAIPYFWQHLKCPVYATPFTATVLKKKLQQEGFDPGKRLVIVEKSSQFEVGPFTIDLVGLTHSIPEPNSLAIRTPYGTIVHSGDWKLDSHPVIGDPFEQEKIQKIGAEGVLALVCDSTNIEEDGWTKSESVLEDSLAEVFSRYDGKRIVVTCFASNIARLATIQRAAAKNNRQTALIGRSLERMEDAARQTGYLQEVDPFVKAEEAGYIPRGNLVLVCTGSQGEGRAALNRIAYDDHPEVALDPGDVVIFSARTIPGNEKDIGALQNQLARKGLSIVTADDELVHVSGHPARDEVIEMYQWLKPEISIPVHGEYRHLKTHAELAKACQVPHALIVENGQLLRLGPGAPEIVDEIEIVPRGISGQRMIPLDGNTIRERKKMNWNGAIIASLAFDHHDELLSDPEITLLGLAEEEDQSNIISKMIDEIYTTLEDFDAAPSNAQLKEACRVTLRRFWSRHFDQKPLTYIHLHREED